MDVVEEIEYLARSLCTSFYHARREAISMGDSSAKEGVRRQSLLISSIMA